MPADPNDPAVDVDTLVERLQRVVEERRQSGEYPPDLEHDLDEHFRRIAARAMDMGDLRGLLNEVRGSAEIGRERINYVSSLPLGTTMHRTIGKAVSRQTQGVITQVNDFARAVVVLLEAIVQTRPVHETALSDLNARLDAVLERLAAYDRAPVGSPPELRALLARVERLEVDARAVRGARPYSRAKLRRELVGSREDVMAIYLPLAQGFQGSGPVVVVGCGGGELLELLGGLGLEARGVDTDPEVVEEVAARNLAVTRAGALEYLDSMPDQSLGGICLDRVLEEVAADRAVEILSATSEKLRPGGRLLVVGGNPGSIAALAGSWYSDPEHSRPVPAQLVEILLREWGFQEVGSAPVGPAPQGLEPIPAGDVNEAVVAVVNRNVERLNQVLFAPATIAVTAVR